jgi:hypothetical protein
MDANAKMPASALATDMDIDIPRSRATDDQQIRLLESWTYFTALVSLLDLLRQTDGTAIKPIQLLVTGQPPFPINCSRPKSLQDIHDLWSTVKEMDHPHARLFLEMWCEW